MDKEFETELIFLIGHCGAVVQQFGCNFHITLEERHEAVIRCVMLENQFPHVRFFVRNDEPTIVAVNVRYSNNNCERSSHARQ